MGGGGAIVEQAALVEGVRDARIDVAITAKTQQLVLAKQYQVALCEMGFVSQVQKTQAAIAAHEKSQTVLEVVQANTLLDACMIAYEAKTSSSIQKIVAGFSRVKNPTQTAWLGYHAVAMLLAPNTLHGNKSALLLLGDWNKQLQKNQSGAAYNGWLAAMSLMVQRNMQAFLARGDFTKAHAALQKLQALRMQASAPFAKALIAGIMYEQYRSVSNTAEAQKALDDFARNFAAIEDIQQKLRVLKELQRFTVRMLDTDTFLDSLLKTAVDAINNPQDGSAIVMASALLVNADLEQQATEVKSHFSAVEPPMQEQQIAAAAVHDQIARARRMKHTGDVVSASVLMQNLSTTLMQFD